MTEGRGSRSPAAEPGRASSAPRGGGVLRGLVAGLALAGVMAGCVVHRLVGPRLTGTCEGACTHYLACKGGAGKPEHARCRAECPDVFSDRDSLMAFESLSCANAVEYVDGMQRKIAKPR
jgi:hypothetical protein